MFRREVAEQVLPLLLVKRFAFDLELLAVSRALGFGRIRGAADPSRLPLHGLRRALVAVLRALVDTAAIFYRLRILATTSASGASSGAYRLDTAPRLRAARLGPVTPDAAAVSDLDYPTSR